MIKVQKKDNTVIIKPSAIEFVAESLRRNVTGKVNDNYLADGSINICESTIKGSVKEDIAATLQNYFIKYSKIDANGYKDSHSSNVKEHLEEEHPEYTWEKNSPQSPFDVYSVEAGIAIENKTSKISGRKSTKDFSSNSKIILNATLYPDYVRVKDVIPLKEQSKYTEEVLESFMDVLVTVAERDRKTNVVIRYAIVDGSYWGIDYDTYRGACDYYKQVNDDEIMQATLEHIHRKYPDNKFVERKLSGTLEMVTLNNRKLIFVANPIEARA